MAQPTMRHLAQASALALSASAAAVQMPARADSREGTEAGPVFTRKDHYPLSV
jgi:hypothetical protein